MRRSRLANAAAATRSGLQRYPKQILESLKAASEGIVEMPLVQSQIDFEAFERGRLSAAWVGHATVLLRIGGRTVLTDPVFSHRIGMSVGGVTLGPGRLLPPAADVEHLPHIDTVLLSHAHFDHLDKPSLRRLAAGPARGATVVTADRTQALIPDGFGEVLQLAWGRHIRLGDLRIEALRPRHWGARAALDRHRRYNAYLLEHGVERVLFAGDTAMTDAFERLPPVALSVFGIGAYESWGGAHATPEEVWKMFMRVGGTNGTGNDKLLPMHHSTFDMGEKHVDEPMERLLAAAGEEAHRIVCREPGELWSGEQRDAH
jgi:L-ascorbate metabolism protein UlaG (beta-lactamase superfamily)